MNRRLKAGFAGLALAIASVSCPAQERDLPALTVSDPAGARIDLRQLGNGKWVLLVLDADVPMSRDVIAVLQGAPVDWGDKLIVIGQGSVEGQATLRSGGQALVGVRWYGCAAAEVLQALELPGAPAILGIDANGKVVLTFIGFGDAPGRNIDLMRTWVGAQMP